VPDPLVDYFAPEPQTPGGRVPEDTLPSYSAVCGQNFTYFLNRFHPSWLTRSFSPSCSFWPSQTAAPPGEAPHRSRWTA